MSMKSLGRKEDVAASKKAVEREERHFLKIPDSKTPWYLFGVDYTEGYVHWVPLKGFTRRVVCAGGMKGHGFDTDNCPICAYVAGLYIEAKELENDGDSASAIKIKDFAKGIRGKAEFQMKALRGNRLLMKTAKGKKFVADWDASDEDSNAEAGVLSLSESQFLGLTAMVDDDDGFPFISDGPDLAKRVLWTFKEQKKGKNRSYRQVGWLADREESEFPDFEISEEVVDINLEESFVIDMEVVQKTVEMLSGESSEEVDADEPVDYDDNESDEGATPANEYLDDVEEDDELEGEDLVSEENLEEGSEEFEDDIPDDPPPKKSRGASKDRGTGARTSAGRSGKGVASSRGRSTKGSSTSGRRKM